MDTAPLAVVSIVLAVLTFIAQQLAQRNAVGSKRVEELEHRVEELEQKLAAAIAREDGLIRQNTYLMRKLLGLETAVGIPSTPPP